MNQSDLSTSQSISNLRFDIITVCTLRARTRTQQEKFVSAAFYIITKYVPDSDVKHFTQLFMTYLLHIQYMATDICCYIKYTVRDVLQYENWIVHIVSTQHHYIVVTLHIYWRILRRRGIELENNTHTQ